MKPIDRPSAEEWIKGLTKILREMGDEIKVLESENHSFSEELGCVYDNLNALKSENKQLKEQLKKDGRET